jgi:hypothetical protein
MFCVVPQDRQRLLFDPVEISIWFSKVSIGFDMGSVSVISIRRRSVPQHVLASAGIEYESVDHNHLQKICKA